MTNIVALNYETHQSIRVLESRQHNTLINQHLVPLIPAEFFQAATQFPIVITKNNETGEFGFSALMGFEPGENLFVKEGRWNVSYQPLHLQRQPFFVGHDQGQDLVCIDMGSDAVSNDQGARLFNDDQTPTEFLTNVEAVLGKLMLGEQQSRSLVTALLEAELIKPLTLEFEFANGDKQTLNGAYSIDDQRLADLNDEQVLSFYRQGFLALIHLLQVSLENIHAMVDCKNNQNSAAEAWFE